MEDTQYPWQQFVGKGCRYRYAQVVLTLPRVTPYEARAPAQQKQNPGGSVRTSADSLEYRKH